MANPALPSQQDSSTESASPEAGYTSIFGPHIPRTISPQKIELEPSSRVPALHDTSLLGRRQSVPKVNSRSPRVPATYAKALLGRGSQANRVVDSTGAPPPPLRAFAGFAGQQVPQNRNPPLGSTRLQNSKLGVSILWQQSISKALANLFFFRKAMERTGRLVEQRTGRLVYPIHKLDSQARQQRALLRQSGLLSLLHHLTYRKSRPSEDNFIGA